MTVSQLKDLLAQYPDHYTVEVIEDSMSYDIIDVFEAIEPKFDQDGKMIGEQSQEVVLIEI